VVAAPASAQIRFGVKGGILVNSMSFSNNIIDQALDAQNRTGFTGGVMTEIGIPIVGLCADASLMYAHRSAKVDATGNEEFAKRDYLEIPINLKYKFNLPVIKPMIFTGPSFSFLLSDKSPKEFSGVFEYEKWEAAWNVGIGVELLNHLQISASHAWGFNKLLKVSKIGGTTISNDKDGKDKYWTITAAYLF
jgi:hypothetical protein